MLDHARDRRIPSQTGRGHLEVCLDLFASEKMVFPLAAVEVGIGPHVDHDVQDADFNETRLPSQKYCDQYTGLELDPVGAAAARQSEIDFGWRQSIRASTPDGSVSANGTEVATGASESFGRPRNTSDQKPSASRTSPPSHPAHHRSKLFLCFCSLMMSMKGGEPLVLQFLDVSRAYPHAESSA